MGGVTWLINCTLDGRCSHTAVVPDDDLHRHATESLEGVDTVLFGRTTFDLLADYWAEVSRTHPGNDVENGFADAIAAKEKIVYSSRPGEDRWNGRHVTGSAVDDVRRLRDEGRQLLVQASPGLAGSLRAAGLVDRCRLVLQPFVAGAGPLTFAAGEEARLRLDSSHAHASGSVALDYSVA